MSTQISPFEVLFVAGIDALSLARLPYLLHKANCRVTLLSPHSLAVNWSRYVSCHLPTSTEPETRVLHLKEVLSAQSPSFASVIIGDEATLIALAEHRGQAWLDGWFPVDHRSKAIDVTLSKSAFLQAATNAGLHMPSTKLCQGLLEVESAVRLAGYPAMLKSSRGLSGSGVRKVNESSELKSIYTTLAPADEPLLVQHFCEGRLGSTDVLFNHGVPVCWQSSYSLRCWPTPLAASSTRELMQHPDIEAMLSGVGKITGFHGFAGVDWIHEATHLYVLEVNPRPTPTYHLDQYFGVSFSRSFEQLLSGQPKVTPPKLIRHPAPMIRLFPQSLFWAISEHDWRSLFLCWNDAPWHDPVLLGAYLRRVLTHFWPDRWRETARRFREWLRSRGGLRQGL